ncbi:MAG: hypothetical protein N2C14_00575 [Planctomycetales bacterium]
MWTDAQPGAYNTDASQEERRGRMQGDAEGPPSFLESLQQFRRHAVFRGFQPSITWPVLAATLVVATSLASVSEIQSAQADSAADRNQRADKWIEQLGDDYFPAREEAAQALLSTGIEIEGALSKGLKHADPEVRRRCKKLLSVVRDRDYLHRLELFSADVEGENDYGLAGWKRFRKSIGETPAARKLFASMHKSERELMTLSDAEPDALSDGLLDCIYRLQQSLYHSNSSLRREISLSSLAAAFFAASREDARLNRVVESYLANFSHRPAMQQALKNPEVSEIARRLLRGWVLRPTQGGTSTQQFVLALRHDFKEALRPATETLRNAAGTPTDKHYAMLVVGRFGNESHLPLLRGMLKDESVCMTSFHDKKRIEIQARDIALAVLVHVHGLKHADFGMKRATKDPKLLFQAHTLGFEKLDGRTKALRQYETWSKQDVLPKPAAKADD